MNRIARQTFALCSARIPELLRSFVHNNSGATAIEYGVIAAMLSISIVAALGAIGESLSERFGAIAASLDPVPDAPMRTDPQ